MQLPTLANFTPSLPPADLLASVAPDRAWREAWRAAARSPGNRFRMGAVVWQPAEDKLISWGCSHQPQPAPLHLASVHAELHALDRSGEHDLAGAWMFVVSLNRAGNGCPWSCCPCWTCADAMAERGVSRVLFPQRDQHGDWQVIAASPAQLLGEAPPPCGPYARHQRLMVPAFA